MMNIVAIVVAAGSGRRMGGRCKALLSLGGRELIRYSLDLFDRSENIQGVCVAVPGDLLVRFRREMGPRWGYHKIIGWVAGGERRQDSVAAALEMIPDDVSLIAVHDAARPFATEELLDRLIGAANSSGAAIPAIEVVDTIKEIDGSGRVVRSLAREKLRAVQTPQVFASALLRDAYRYAGEKGITVTDDASLIEMMGHEVGVVEGSRDNIKITVPGDIERAKGILKSQIPKEYGLRSLGGGKGALSTRHGAGEEVKIGIGFDAHRFVRGRKLVLGGVEIPHDRGLQGHSDADVLLHAVCDAMLGAAALGDIGLHFPDTDPRYLNIASTVLLGHVKKLVDERGYRVGNVDATIIAEAPRMAPHIERMREKVAGILGCAIGDVGIKATTTERMGFCGRGEGIAAMAVACVMRREG